MMRNSMCLAVLITVTLLNVVPCGVFADDLDDLVELRKVVLPVLRQNEAAMHPSGPEPFDLMKRIAISRWRFDVERGIRLLVNSSDEEEQIVGWKLAGERMYPLNWTQADIDKLLQNTDIIRPRGIDSIAETDPYWLPYCLRSILASSQLTSNQKRSYWHNISKIPNNSERTKFWLEVSEKPSWMRPCLETFESVSESKEAVDVLVKLLDRKEQIFVSYSMDTGGYSPYRLVVVEKLKSVRGHRDYVAQQIRQRIEGLTPNAGEVQFVTSAVCTLYRMSPKSSDADEILTRWYQELPKYRTLILQSTVKELAAARKLEAAVISSIAEIDAELRFGVCEWLMERDSDEAKNAIRMLMDDPYPGTKLAATIAFANVDPTFDTVASREKLFQLATDSPVEFSRPFWEIGRALAYLSQAGQSDEEAIAWLTAKKTSSPQLEAQIVEAIQEVEETSKYKPALKSMSWRSAIPRDLNLPENAGIRERARSPRPRTE